MNRVFQIVEYGENVPLQFTCKASSTEGVFRSFAKTHVKYLKCDTLYSLYGAVAFGFQKIAAAFWNGKAFVPVATKIINQELFNEFLLNNPGFSVMYKPAYEYPSKDVLEKAQK